MYLVPLLYFSNEDAFISLYRNKSLGSNNSSENLDGSTGKSPVDSNPLIMFYGVTACCRTTPRSSLNFIPLDLEWSKNVFIEGLYSMVNLIIIPSSMILIFELLHLRLLEFLYYGSFENNAQTELRTTI